MREHFHPRWSEIVQRFNSRVRQSNEIIAAFVAELRKLSEFCNFEDKLDKTLRDRLVCGINYPVNAEASLIGNRFDSCQNA